MTVRLIAFATREFFRSAAELEQSAARYGVPTTVYTPASPEMVAFARTYPEIARLPRGAGYWLWKPWLIWHALANSAEGDVIIYADAGSCFVSDPAQLVALTDAQPVVVFGHRSVGEPGGMMRYWTKRDCFVLLDADTEAYWNAQCCTAGFQVYRNSPEARAFVDELLASCADPRVLTDAPNVMGLDNLPEFRDHRHDQSVLTILALKHGLPEHTDPSQYGAPHTGAAFGQVFDCHRRRHIPLPTRLWRGVRRRLRLLLAPT
jgi:hypothetical protein